ncbi:MAG: hypothetical protein WCQ55_00810, partial [Paludibacteraceae bacterium]
MKRHFYISLLLLLWSITGAFSQSMLISGGNDHGVALCNKGQIFAWGYNGGNRLGLKSPYDAQEVVTKPQMVDIPAGLTFSQVTAGSGATNIALACTKVVYAWGENKVGTAGQPTGDVISTPMPVFCGEATDHGFDVDGVSSGPYLGGVKMVGGTTSAGIALLDDGKAVIWGGNGRYQSGPTYPLLKAESHLPIYIRDKNGKPLENIIHISGGDNNILLIVGSSKDASVGVAYSMGSVNGRGTGDGGNGDASTFYAAPVLMMDPTSIANGTYTTNNEQLLKVKTTGISDKGGFAVDENTGFLYGWGGNGWNGCIGLEVQSDKFVYASKVLSGEYVEISNEPYMTNVHQVIGGNGYGACVTEDHYMLYWGVHAPASNSGGVVPNSTWANKTGFSGTNIDPGPVFANYCAGEKGPKEVRVDDALAIGRGDLFGFMVNMDGDFYVWGSTKRPGNDTPQEVGTLGLGFAGKSDDPQGTGYRTCLSKIELDCEPQDECPTVYMIGPRYKCPGESDSLYCGFTPTKKSIDRYFFQWEFNGQVLNTSTSTDSEAKRKADKWNNWIVEVEDPGTYKVTIVYVGNNVPCTNCPDAVGEIEVIDMDMPVDTIVTNMNCVADPVNPSAVDNICFEAVTNDKFYNATQMTSFAAFSTATSTDTLEVFKVKGAGGTMNFCVSGDKIAASEVHDNKDESSKDTIYNVWLEDITKFETILFPTSTPATASGGYQSYTDIICVHSAVELISFDLYGKGYGQPVNVTVTPVIYNAGKMKDGQYIFSSEYFRGNPQIVTFDGTTPTKATINLNVKLPGNAARGTMYVLAMVVSGGGHNLYNFNFPDPGSGVMFDKPIEDPNNFGITVVGSTANGFVTGNGNRVSVFTNITFGKLTDYDCGRIMLSARYGCPPCNRPDAKANGKYVEIESSQAAEDDTIRLCKESADLTLSVKDVKNTTVAGSSFDILWFDNEANMADDTKAIKSDVTGTATASSIDVKWTDLTPGETKTYYVKVRDHEKNTAAACFVFDSIKVKANIVPVVPEIEIDPFCEGSLSLAELQVMADKFSFKGLTSDVQTAAGISLPASALLLEFSSLTAGSHKYKVIVTDDATGCVSEPKTVEITVWENPEETLAATADFCEGANVALPSSAKSYTLAWYKDAAGSGLANETLSALAGSTTPYEYYYTVTDANGCVSDTLPYAFTVKPIATVLFDTTMVCGKTTATKKNDTPAGAKLVWTLNGTAVSTTEFSEPTYTGDLGELAVYAEATGYCNSDTARLTQLHVKAVPTAPTGTKTVTYLLSDAENGTFKDLLSQKAEAVDIETGYDYNWYSSDGVSLGTTVPTPSVPASTVTEDQQLTYTVTRTNADGCESDPTTVNVTIYLTPAPTTVPVEYCLNSTMSVPLTAAINDPNGVGEFTLQWYDTDKTTKISAPTPDVTTAGSKTYYVSQISTAGAESSLVPLTVTVYDVALPTLDATNVLKYCSAETATALSATLNSDATTYMMGDKLVWTLEGTETASVTPNTSVTATTTYKYGVSQTYTVPSSSEVCKGTEVSTSVTVTYVPVLKTESVLYLKTDAENGTFAKNIKQQNPSVYSGEEAGATLNWYESDCTTPITGTPTPTVDPTMPEGTDQTVTYCVSQTVDGCESGREKVEVTISDSPVPTGNDVIYC